MKTTKKQRTWNRWSKCNPTTHERTLMLKHCGKKCFLGSKKSFPICNKGTCKRNRLGVLAAYVRAKEYASIRKAKTQKRYYNKIANRANKMLKKTRKLYIS